MALQSELFDIPSPCQGICQYNSKGYCIGCYRNKEERFLWYSYTNEKRRHILRLCKQRKKIAYKNSMMALAEPSSTEFSQPSLFDELL